MRRLKWDLVIKERGAGNWKIIEDTDWENFTRMIRLAEERRQREREELEKEMAKGLHGPHDNSRREPMKPVIRFAKIFWLAFWASVMTLAIFIPMTLAAVLSTTGNSHSPSRRYGRA